MAVTELGSFSRAAVHCRVSQPALSEQIKKLEARMGKMLLNRNHRRIVPTAAGVILIEGANEILAQVENTKQKIRRSDEPHIGHVALGILPTVAPFLLTHVLDSFVAQHPNTQVVVHEKVTGQSLELIEAGKLDLGTGFNSVGTKIGNTSHCGAMPLACIAETIAPPRMHAVMRQRFHVAPHELQFRRHKTLPTDSTNDERR